FAVKAREEGTRVQEQAQQLRFSRADEHPGTASVEKTVLVRIRLHEPRLEPPAHRDCAAAPQLVKQTVEDLVNRVGLGGNEQHLGHSIASQMADVPAEDVLPVSDH